MFLDRGVQGPAHAQHQFDLVTAQEIQAENDLRVKKLALDSLVGKPNVQPNPLAITTLPPPADLPPKPPGPFPPRGRRASESFSLWAAS